MRDTMSRRGWREYWRENRLAACTPDDPDAAAAIEAHWCDYFGTLPGTARVLDIATGNGVLLLWAHRASRGALDCTGVDLADIDPARFLPQHREALAAVRFVGNTAAERLPFPDHSFDSVVSQYGIEYADLGGALAEAARVLVPGGQLRWLAHVAGSSIVAEGAAQIVEIDLLLHAEGPFARMREFVTAQRRGRRVARATENLTAALKKAQAFCEAHPRSTLLRQLCGGILETANNLARFHDDDIAQWLAENERRLRGQQQRIRDLRAASLDAARLQRAEALLSAGPWSALRHQELRVPGSGHCLGCSFSAVRAS